MASRPNAIELRHLRYFLAVVDELHFGRAAEQLHVAQPAVSRAIRRLEEELGVQLLHRTRRGVSLTEAGQAFAVEGRQILGHVEQAVGEARRAGGVGSTLRVGCLDLVPIEPLERFVNAVRRQEPGLQVKVTHLPSREQIRRLREGALDLGVLIDAADHQDIETRPVFAGESLEALLPPNHRLARRRVLRPMDLDDEVLVTGPRAPNPALYDRFMALLQDGGYRFRTVNELATTNPRDVVLAVATGEAVMLRPPSFRPVDEDKLDVTRMPLAPAPRMPDTVVAWRSNQPHHLGRVLDSVIQIAQSLRQEPVPRTNSSGSA
jgi:DNA-binding transcriptional LysR family regulator